MNVVIALPKEKVFNCKRKYQKLHAMRAVLLTIQNNKALVQELNISKENHLAAQDEFKKSLADYENWWDNITKEYNIPDKNDEDHMLDLNFISCKLSCSEKQ